MATTTPNFGWPVPTSTDLVKDGATAIEALGDGIDTSLVDLKGGTTGQVLSKATSADMDFTWVTSDDANAIQNTIVDAKGDLIAASASDVPARLAVGANGETLVADSSTSTGLRYTAGNALGNPVINSAFQVWQRGTSFTTTGYSADRWYASIGTNFTFSRQLTNDTTNLPNIQYCMRLARNSGATTVAYPQITNSFETINTIPYVGKTVTFSFYARKGADWSGASSQIFGYLQSGTGTDQNLNSGYTGNVTVAGGAITVTTTWQRFSYTGTLGTTATEMGVQFFGLTAGTAGANDYFEVTGVQIDVGSVALPFRTYAGTIQGELAACQRYYWRAGGQQAYQSLGMGIAQGTTNINFYVANPVPMRAGSGVGDYSTITGFNGAAFFTPSAVGFAIGNSASRVTFTVTGATSGAAYEMLTNNSTSGYIGFNAEL